MKLGAEVDGLDALARSLESAAGRLEATRGELAAASASIVWRGADADRFRRQWDLELGPMTLGADARLRGAASDVRRQAADQRRASAGDGLASGAARGAASGVVPLSAGRPAPAAPTRIRLVSLSVAGGNAVVGGIQVNLRIEDLGTGRSRVVELDRISGGISANRSSRIAIAAGDVSIGVGGSASATATAMLGGERSWIVPTDEVETFLGSRAVRTIGGDDAAAVGSWLAGAPGVGMVAGVVGVGEAAEVLSYEPPAPERVGLEVGNDVWAAATGSSSIADLDGLAASETVFGLSRDTADGTVTLRTSTTVAASIAAAVGGAAWGSSPDASTAVSLQLDRRGRPLRLSVDTTTPSGPEITQEHVVLDLTRPEVREAARRLVDELGHSTHVRGGVPPAISSAVDEVVAASVGTATAWTDVYRIDGEKQYGIELPLGSATVTYQDLRLER